MRKIDAKSQTTGELQKLDGTAIPEDEPLIMFRGKDKLLPQMLRYYNQISRDAGATEPQLTTVQAKIREVEQWQAANPAKLKVPDYKSPQ